MGEIPNWIIAVCALGALGVSLWNRHGIKELHVAVNSRLTELLTITAAAARAEGKVEQQEAHAAVPITTPAKDQET